MTRIRHHSVSLLAVLLALALGIALGGGPLSSIGSADGATDGGGAPAATGRQETKAERSAAAFQDEVTTTVAPGLLDGTLARRPVAVLALPGADKLVVAGLEEGVESAGGVVTGTFWARRSLVAPDQKSLVDTLGRQVTKSVEGTGVPEDATTYDRIGQLVGRALGSTENTGGTSDAPGADILSSLRGAKLLNAPAEVRRTASLVLVVLGDEPVDDEGADNIYGGLLTGIADRTDGVVLAGTTASATDGLLALLRQDPDTTEAVSTTDSVQTAAGRVLAVLALAAEKSGGPGQYGAAGADGTLPEPAEKN